MRILTVGGGGREHAIVEALHRSGAEVFSAMRNDNPGIARRSVRTLMVDETDVASVVAFAVEVGAELAFIGPEAPLEVGLADALEANGIGAVGPTKAAARLETSKSFMRDLLERHGIPGNLAYRHFDDLSEAEAFILSTDMELVVKPVGLTGGKGVRVEGEHMTTKQEVIDYVREIFENDIGGGAVVLEERAVGEEFTLMAFVDGADLVPMPIVQDHKRAYEGDVGPNTGGMGSYSAEDHLLPFVKPEERTLALETMRATVSAMAEEGCPYRGILYGQFMLTEDGPRVIEFNARFGDPEGMNVLSILESDLGDICRAMVDGTLASADVRFASKATVCKYVVPAGYGVESEVGATISVDEGAIADTGAMLYYASVNSDGDIVRTTSSRSLAIVGLGDDIASAEHVCERALAHVRSDRIFVRHDIGRASIVRSKVERMDSIRGSR